MTPTVRTLAEAPALERAMHRLHGVAWPPFLRDDGASALWPRLYTDFPESQLALCGPGGRVVAIGNTVPFQEANVWMLHRVPASPSRPTRRGTSP